MSWRTRERSEPGPDGLPFVRPASTVDVGLLAKGAVSKKTRMPERNSILADARGRALRDLRIAVTDRCNFRCPYCMPADVYGERYEFLPRPELLSFEEIERVARAAVALGVRKLRVTGGEPLIRADLPRLIERLAAIRGLEDLALTTNGSLLAQYAASLKQAGLRRVTVSLDSLDEGVFQRLNGVQCSLGRVLAGIEAAERAGFTPIKINCAVVRGMNDHTIVDLARRFQATGHIVRFIEYMDVGTRNRWNLSQVVPVGEIVERIAAELPIEPAAANYHGEVARRYLYKDGSGEIGMISSVSQPFCASCTRARLTTDGRLVTCLFASAGHDLKTALRSGASDAEIREILRALWLNRADRYSEERSQRTREDRGNGKIEMYQVGG